VFEEDIRLEGVTVLIVDDEPDARHLVQRLLQSRGATVSAAESAAAGIAFLLQHPCDVIVSDIGMPDEDGYSFLRRVRALAGRSDTPAIALTAFARSEDRVRAMLAGFQMHVAKPVEPIEFITMVAALAGRVRTPFG
jgi:CheY-like chemotaxis protein